MVYQLLQLIDNDEQILPVGLFALSHYLVSAFILLFNFYLSFYWKEKAASAALKLSLCLVKVR